MIKWLFLGTFTKSTWLSLSLRKKCTWNDRGWRNSFPSYMPDLFLSFCRSSAWVMTTNTTAAKVYLPIAPASRWRTWKLISRTLWRLQPEPTQGWDSGARNMSLVKLSKNIVTAPLTISFIFVFVSIVYWILSEFSWEFSISYILDPQN